MNFRRFLKLLIKNRQKDNTINIPGVMAKYGFYASDYNVIDILCKYPQADGRAFFRIGRAAKKQGKVVDLLCLALAKQYNKDMRLIPFSHEKITENVIGRHLWNHIYRLRETCFKAFKYNDHDSLDVLYQLQKPIIER